MIEALIRGRSPAIVRLREEIVALARTPLACLLVVGETGVGKELVPRALHALHPEMRGPLVVFNCPAVPHDHLESELFGTVRGAFTGAVDRPGAVEHARGGLLALDEIGAMALDHQAKILRLLENREGRRLGSPLGYRVETSFAASTNEEPAAAVRSGRLREDLYYRLAQDAVIRVPPLRERIEDAPLLAQMALESLGSFVATPAALAVLESHDWPGNVRELRAVMRTAARLTGAGRGPAPLGAEQVSEAIARVSLGPEVKRIQVVESS